MKWEIEGEEKRGRVGGGGQSIRLHRDWNFKIENILSYKVKKDSAFQLRLCLVHHLHTFSLYNDYHFYIQQTISQTTLIEHGC